LRAIKLLISNIYITPTSKNRSLGTPNRTERERMEIRRRGPGGPRDSRPGGRRYRRAALARHGIRGFPGPQMRGTWGTHHTVAWTGRSTRQPAGRPALQNGGACASWDSWFPRSPNARDLGHPTHGGVDQEVHATAGREAGATEGGATEGGATEGGATGGGATGRRLYGRAVLGGRRCGFLPATLTRYT